MPVTLTAKGIATLAGKLPIATAIAIPSQIIPKSIDDMTEAEFIYAWKQKRDAINAAQRMKQIDVKDTKLPVRCAQYKAASGMEPLRTIVVVDRQIYFKSSGKSNVFKYPNVFFPSGGIASSGWVEKQHTTLDSSWFIPLMAILYPDELVLLQLLHKGVGKFNKDVRSESKNAEPDDAMYIWHFFAYFKTWDQLQTSFQLGGTPAVFKTTRDFVLNNEWSDSSQKFTKRLSPLPLLTISTECPILEANELTKWVNKGN